MFKFSKSYQILSYIRYKSVPNGDVMETIDKWLTIDDLANYIKVSRTKLYGMAQRGEIPASKIGNQWRFDRGRIDKWMDTHSNHAIGNNLEA